MDWWASLPEDTDCKDLTPSGPLFRSNVHLKLDYCLTRIFIGRPFLFSNMKSSFPNQGVSPAKPSTGLSKHRSTLVTDCVEAALEIVDLCRLLRDETGLARASFTEFSSCRAALLVILAQSLSKRTERLRASLNQGMGLIRIMSMGLGSARSAVSVIEALERAICRLEMWSGTRAAETSAASAGSGYDRFKNWEMLWKSGPISSGTAAFQDQCTAAGNGLGAAVTPMTPATGMDSVGSSFKDDIMMGTDMVKTGLTTSADFTSPSNPLAQMPQFGLDHFVSNFPQELDEFTAIPCFEPDSTTPYSLGDASNQTGTGWMKFYE